MKDSEFKDCYAGVFAESGLWINSENEYIEISSMDYDYRLRTISHLLSALYLMNRSESAYTGIITFSGRFSDDLAKKLNELGCKVSESSAGEYQMKKFDY
ncbi:hypothetical protein [Paenibacillus sinopodophylli]|uniref:hypothetical protein n=1 Tax=Paenibacillus sinopodophylli TaxID=1837342 RepID=UPI00110D17B9|nr:hypothetical protein [Paenibacillus sinopodophylli]